MAKKKATSKRPTKRNGPRARATGGGPAAGFQSLLSDPCNGPVASYYGGETGIVQRFVSDVVLNTTATHTCGFAVFNPASNTIVQYTAADPSAFGAPASAQGPGNTFIAANARKIRPLAACVTVLPSAVSMTNMTGEIAVANISSNSVDASGGFNVNGVFQLTNARAVLAKRSYDVKWYPALMDSTYAPVLSTGIGSLTDPADHNSILVAWRGYPAGVGLSLRFTTVIEWTPAANLGLAVTTAPKAPVPHQTLSAMLHSYNPSWWHNLMGDVTGHVAREGGRAVKQLASYGIAQAVRYGTSALPALMAA